MIYLSKSDIPKESLERINNFKNINGTDNPNEEIKGFNGFPFKTRLYNSKDHVRFEEITKELETLKERIKYFDGEGCINATPFDDSTWSFPHNGLDHRKHAFVNE